MASITTSMPTGIISSGTKWCIKDIFEWGSDHPPYKYSLVVCDESGHTKFPFSLASLSWGELWLICPELG